MNYIKIMTAFVQSTGRRTMFPVFTQMSLSSMIMFVWHSECPATTQVATSYRPSIDVVDWAKALFLRSLCRLGLSMAMPRSTCGSSHRSPTSRLDKDCGLLHPTIYSFLPSDCLLLDVAPSLSPALAHGTTHRSMSPQHHLCSPSGNDFTCKNCFPYNLYCVGGDIKHCSIQSNSEND